MKPVITLLLLFCGCAQALADTTTPNAVSLRASGGIVSGPAFSLDLQVSNLVSLPVGFRATVAYARPDGFDDGASCESVGVRSCGEYFKERAQFPREESHNLLFGADLVYQAPLPEDQRGALSAFIGPRFNVFSTSLSGSESSVMFSSNQFGLGGGLTGTLPLSEHWSLTADAGVERYFKSSITGRSTPEGDHIVYRPGTSEYQFVDRFVRQPEWLFKLMVGVAYRF